MAGIVAYSIYSSGEAADDAAQGQKDAAASSLQATEKNIDFQKWLWGEQKDLAQPFADMGTDAIPEYQSLLDKPINPKEDPGYQFGINEGTRARENSASSKGMQLSGPQQKSMQRFGNDYGSTKYNEAFNRRQVGLDNLYRMIMSGQAAAAGQAQTGTAMGSQVSNSILSGGQAQNQMYQNIGNIRANENMAGVNTVLDVGNMAATYYGAGGGK